MKILLLLCLFLDVIREIQADHVGQDDYFSESFDPQKNCKYKKLMEKLEKEKKCAEVNKGYLRFPLTKES